MLCICKKALVRELIDDYFEKVHNISSSELWELSSQLSRAWKKFE